MREEFVGTSQPTVNDTSWRDVVEVPLKIEDFLCTSNVTVAETTWTGQVETSYKTTPEHVQTTPPGIFNTDWKQYALLRYQSPDPDLLHTTEPVFKSTTWS